MQVRVSRIHAALWGCILSATLFGQTAPDTYWIQFTDKEGTPYSLDQPEEFLSARSIARRIAQDIPFDELDLPVDPAYIDLVLSMGDVQLVNRSKWFNAITVRTTDHEALNAILELPVVLTVRSSGLSTAPGSINNKFRDPYPGTERDGEAELYGPSFRQIEMLNGHQLHGMDAKGQGMLIGVLDSGFDGVDSSNAFQPLRDRGGLVLARDLVDLGGDVFQGNSHGRSVLSCMAGQLPGAIFGTAPEADYVLLRTEDTDSEYPVEEDNWISGAELADSLGCDMLNTSLGYTTFDDSTMDHRYEDLDGQTLRISIAANIASRKGMIPVQSAGNSGTSEWYYISAPADAIDILATGAVGDVENYAPFSSHGPSADGRVKPDVCAMGWGSIVLRPDVDSVAAANGTSFAAPILAGLVACLWQLHPERTSQQIMDAVRRSGSFFSTPSDSLGHGVPDFAAAHAWLELTAGLAGRVGEEVRVFPVPFQDELFLRLSSGTNGPVRISLVDASGRMVVDLRTTANSDGLIRIGSGLGTLASGAYVLRVEQGGRILQKATIKAP